MAGRSRRPRRSPRGKRRADTRPRTSLEAGPLKQSLRVARRDEAPVGARRRPERKIARAAFAARAISCPPSSAEAGGGTCMLAVEQLQDQLAVLVGDRQRLNAELLLRLQSLQTGGSYVHVRVDQRGYAVGVVRRQG